MICFRSLARTPLRAVGKGCQTSGTHLVAAYGRTSARSAFTLIEILVTLFIMMILASVALPMTRNIIKDQRNARATQILLSFIDSTRNQAIAEDREMGVLFDRFSDQGFGRSASVRVRQLRGLPAYTGETAKAQAILFHDTSFPPGGTEINAARFDPIENQLLMLSADILADGNRSNDTSPIRLGDRLELPGGRLVSIRKIYREPPVDVLSAVIVNFHLRDPADPTSSFVTARTHPQRALRESTPLQRVRYAIHRSPIISNTRTVSLPRGTAIDFNYSGFGVRGNEFSPDLADDTVVAKPIIVIFDGKGRISRVQNAAGVSGPPVSQLFFCVGDIDGVRPDDLFATDRRTRANILRPNSAWIVMNPATGRVSASPFTSAGDFSTLSVNGAIEQTRRLANVGDTLE